MSKKDRPDMHRTLKRVTIETFSDLDEIVAAIQQLKVARFTVDALRLPVVDAPLDVPRAWRVNLDDPIRTPRQIDTDTLKRQYVEAFGDAGARAVAKSAVIEAPSSRRVSRGTKSLHKLKKDDNGRRIDVDATLAALGRTRDEVLRPDHKWRRGTVEARLRISMGRRKDA